MGIRIAGVCVLCFALATAATSEAAIVTFNGKASEGGSAVFNGTYIEDGISITKTSLTTMFFVDNNFPSGDIVMFDDDVLEFNGNAGALTIVAVGGGNFDFISAEFGGLNNSFGTGLLQSRVTFLLAGRSHRA